MKEEIRNIGKEESGVSPVIAVILMVAITVVLAAVLFAWSQQLAGTAGGTVATGFIKVERLTSSGDYKVTVDGAGSFAISSMQVRVADDEGNLIYSANVAEDDSDHPAYIKSDDGSTAGADLSVNIGLYMVPDTTSSDIMNGSKAIATYSNGWTVNASISPNDTAFVDSYSQYVKDLKNVLFIVFDNDDNAEFNTGDFIRIFDNYDSDSADEVSNGYHIDIYSNGQPVDADGEDL